MAKIEEVDYVQIKDMASEMRTKGKELNGELTAAYQTASEMKTNWYGIRYNSLVTEFNNVTTTINEMLKLIIGEVPFALETIANNYSQADQGMNVVSASNEAPNSIQNIEASKETTLKFLQAEVENAKSAIEKNFDNAKIDMGEISDIFNKITWQSEAADAFRTQFAAAKSNVETALDNLKLQFGELMGAAITDVSSAESANTVQG